MNGSVYILYIVSNWTEYMGCMSKVSILYIKYIPEN